MMLVPSRKLSVNRESGTTCGTGADCAFNFDRIHVLDVYDPVCDTVFLIARGYDEHIKITMHNGGEEGGDHDGDDGEDNGRRLIGEDDGYTVEKKV
ncbi:hypothetical protein Tco_0757337 [Tanacetum coccineum]